MLQLHKKEGISPTTYTYLVMREVFRKTKILGEVDMKFPYSNRVPSLNSLMEFIQKAK